VVIGNGLIQEVVAIKIGVVKYVVILGKQKKAIIIAVPGKL
jgi:hypothetical protein